MELIQKEIYRGKRVFLTGHTGFKGAWMWMWLHRLGAVTKGYALAPHTPRDIYTLIDGDSLGDSVIADIRDKQRLEKEILDFQPDFIFHLAAQPLVRESYQNPIETYETNVMGTAHVLETVRKLGKKCQVIIITTDKVYENKEWDYPYRENDRLGGHDPYSASKAAAELVVSSYRNSFFHADRYETHKKGIAVARAGNVIGGGDWSEHRLLPDIIRYVENNQTILIRNPSAVRPWQHVLEPVSGYLMLGMRLEENPVKFSQAYNFGPWQQDTLTVEEIVKKVIKLWGKGTYTIEKDANAPHEAGLLKLDISKTIREIGWIPKLNSEQSLSFTLEWYMSVDTKKETNRQIEHYL